MIERRKDCDHGEQCLVIVILTIVANIRVYLGKFVVRYFDSNNTADSNNALLLFLSVFDSSGIIRRNSAQINPRDNEKLGRQTVDAVTRVNRKISKSFFPKS